MSIEHPNANSAIVTIREFGAMSEAQILNCSWLDARPHRLHAQIIYSDEVKRDAIRSQTTARKRYFVC